MSDRVTVTAYVVHPGRIIVIRLDSGPPTDDPFHTFSEWETAADNEAYADL